jgi:signal transduction histidine kinase
VFRTLYGRLAAALLALLVFSGACWLAVTLVAARSLVDEVTQKLNRKVAAHLVDDLSLLEGGRVNDAALERAFHMIMVVNPSLELYLLDTGGRILAFSAAPGEVVSDRVDLAPVGRFLDGGATGMPLLGDDPRAEGRLKAFSAAVVGDPLRPEGYLYVVLGGERYDSALQMLEGSAILRSGTAVILVTLLVTLAAGLFIFSVITRRIRRLSAAVEAFERGGFERPPEERFDPGRGGDEIDRLAASFGQMAARMAGLIGQLRESDAARRDLVASVSHDLRTPLASLQGYLETLILREGKLDPEGRRYLESAMGHSERLGRLIGTLFELARLEAPATRLQPEPFSLPDLIQDVVQKFQLPAEKAGIRLEADAGGAIPPVIGEIGLIERVLENLLDNAIRHTPPGGEISVGVRCVEDRVHVQVRDTGRGIPEESLPRIFERFYRADPAGARAGLGLAISRRILELHGGHITAASPPGAGAVFSFDLPAGDGGARA